MRDWVKEHPKGTKGEFDAHWALVRADPAAWKVRERLAGRKLWLTYNAGISGSCSSRPRSSLLLTRSATLRQLLLQAALLILVVLMRRHLCWWNDLTIAPPDLPSTIWCVVCYYHETSHKLC